MTTICHIGAAIGRWAEGVRARNQLRRELAFIDSNGDLDVILADIGLTRAHVKPLVAGSPDARLLLLSMLERLGLARERVPVEAVREMGWACTTCVDKGRCREWLANGEETEYRAFCPNAALLDYELLKQRRGSA
jgi:hypothetical protein